MAQVARKRLAEKSARRVRGAIGLVDLERRKIGWIWRIGKITKSVDRKIGKSVDRAHGTSAGHKGPLLDGV
jgi:hypothetical protein